MIEKGEEIALDDDRKFVVLDNIVEDQNNYLYLLGLFKPATVKFAVQKGLEDSDDIEIEIINNPEQKKLLLDKFQNHN